MLAFERREGQLLREVCHSAKRRRAKATLRRLQAKEIEDEEATEPERILLEAADPDREGGSFGGYLPTLGIFLIFPRFLIEFHDFSMKFINF